MAKTMTCLKAMDGGGIAKEARGNALVGALTIAPNHRKDNTKMDRLLAMTGAAAVAVLCAALPSASSAGNAQLNGNAELPIIGWGAFSEKNASEERYREAREAGFTHLTQWCTSPAEAKRLLSAAEKAGIKLIIGMRTNGVKGMTDKAKAFTAAVKNSPALDAYYITDEPNISATNLLRECVRRFQALDPAHPAYVNLFGAHCDRWTRNDEARQRKYTGCATHDEYIRKLYASVPLKMISFDMYPVLSFRQLKDGDFRLHGQRVFLKERWYETLETTSALARELDIPMYAFALVAAHRHYPGQDYPVPTIEHLRLQMYSNLAYGAQALQCFKYAMEREYHGYNNAPVVTCGLRSPVYERIREMNKEIQARAYVFAGCRVQGVWHTGIDIPLGTKRFKNECLPPFVTSFSIPAEDTAVVSWLKNGGKDYLMVVNRNPNDDISFEAKFAEGTEIVRRDGTRAKASAYAGYFWLDPGDAAIFAAQ